MNWKQFLKTDWRKILIFILIIVFSISLFILADWECYISKSKPPPMSLGNCYSIITANYLIAILLFFDICLILLLLYITIWKNFLKPRNLKFIILLIIVFISTLSAVSSSSTIIMTSVPTKIVGVSYFYFPLLWTNSEFWGLYFDYQFRAYYPYEIPNWEIYLYNTEPSVSKLVETVGNIIYQPIFIAPLIISIIINLPYWYLLSCLIVLVYDNLKKRK